MIWKILKHLKRGSSWGDPERMDPLLLFILDRIIDELPTGCVAKIHCGFKTVGHSSKSMHYKAKAVDFHIVGVPFLVAETLISEFLHKTGLVDLVGFGIYPEWNSPGFHLDTRGKRASWGRVGGEYVAYASALEYAKTEKVV